MFRSAHHVWKSKYRGGGARFVIFITMGTVISLAAFVLGIAYVTGIIQAPAPDTESYRPAGIGLCVAAFVSLFSFLLAVRWYAHQDVAEDDAKAP